MGFEKKCVGQKSVSDEYHRCEWAPMTNKEAIIGSIRMGERTKVRRLVKEGHHFPEILDEGIELAVGENQVDILKDFLNTNNPNQRLIRHVKRLLLEACADGKLLVMDAILEFLSQHCDPPKTNFYPYIKTANEAHNALALRKLLKHDHTPRKPYAYKELKKALKDNCFTCANVLLETYPELVDKVLDDPMVDPSLGDNLLLRVALKGDNPDVVRRILGDPRVDPTTSHGLLSVAYYSRSTLLPLLEDGRVDPTENYLQVFHRVIRDLPCGSAQGERGEHEGMVRLMLAHPKMVEKRPYKDEDAILLAVKADNADIVGELLDFGYNPDVTKEKALSWAIRMGKNVVVSALVERARGFSQDDICDFLQIAVISRNLVAARTLLGLPNADPSWRNYQLVAWAAESRFKAMIRLLLRDLRVSVPEVQRMGLPQRQLHKEVRAYYRWRWKSVIAVARVVAHFGHAWRSRYYAPGGQGFSRAAERFKTRNKTILSS